MLSGLAPARGGPPVQAPSVRSYLFEALFCSKLFVRASSARMLAELRDLSRHSWRASHLEGRGTEHDTFNDQGRIKRYGPIEGHLPSRRWHQTLQHQAPQHQALPHQRSRPHQTAQPPGSMASCAHERLLRGLSPRWVFSRSPFSRSLVPRGPCPRSLSPDCLPLPPLDVPDGPLTTRAGQRTSSVTQRHAMTNRRA